MKHLKRFHTATLAAREEPFILGCFFWERSDEIPDIRDGKGRPRHFVEGKMVI